jgi:hypothetical protein
VLMGLLFLLVCAGGAVAQGLRPVRPLEGYACKKLNVTEREAMSPDGAGVNLRAGPNALSPVVAIAPAVLFVKNAAPVNGFVEVMRLNGQPGWIELGRVKPFDVNARCVPSIMSDGRPGMG